MELWKKISRRRYCNLQHELQWIKHWLSWLTRLQFLRPAKLHVSLPKVLGKTPRRTLRYKRVKAQLRFHKDTDSPPNVLVRFIKALISPCDEWWNGWLRTINGGEKLLVLHKPGDGASNHYSRRLEDCYLILSRDCSKMWTYKQPQ